MLSLPDILLIVATAATSTAVVTVIALLILRLNRRGSVVSQFAVIVVAATASIVSSTIAIAAEMYFSPHDLTVLMWVVAVAAIFSLTSAWFTARSARLSMAALREAARRIGQGVVVDADLRGWRELSEISVQLAEASTTLAAARQEIEQLDAARREFFSWISHDLRTPLTGISALAEALEAGIAEDPSLYHRQILREVETMTRLVDDLFKLSRLQSGAFTLRREPVQLIDVVSDAVMDVHSIAEVREIRITASGIDGIVVLGDSHELTRALVNLLMNAIRYGPERSDVLVSGHASDEARVIVTVWDRGEGVPPENLEHMFDVGWQASSARTPTGSDSDRSGAGLGLAIVRGVIEAHGGSVWAAHIDEGFGVSAALPWVPNDLVAHPGNVRLLGRLDSESD